MTLTKKIIIAVLAILVIAGFFVVKHSHLGNSSKSASSSDKLASDTIVIQNFSFSPSTLTVKGGSTVTVVNKDIPAHTVTSDAAGAFDTGLIAQDATGSFTAPTNPGSYGFFCQPHPSMRGILVVQ